jgi:chromosomal replication initiation ATPase DnaA
MTVASGSDYAQMSLDLRLEPRLGRADFLIAPSNETALALCDSWPHWPDPVLLLIGPEGAGKSHLGAIWAHRTGATIIQAADLTLASLPDLVSRGALLVEDVDRAGDGEAILFHLLNLVRAGESFLVLTARTPPEHWGLTIADLLSRLRLATRASLGEADDALLKAVLIKLFHDRQIEVDTSVIDYIVPRIERSLNAVRALVDTLDREALARQRPVTRALAALILAGATDEPDDDVLHDDVP